MIRVFTADNTAEAHLISGLLEKNGIPTVIHGSDSLHGIGQPITVWIRNAHDKAGARKILDERFAADENIERKHGARAPEKKDRSGFIYGMVAGVLMGLAVSHYYPAAHELPEMPASQDRNGDGKADVWYEYHDQELTTESYDQNYDGSADSWYYYGNNALVRIEIDRNYDNAPDEWAKYHTSGNLAETQYDMNFDGKPDHWEQYSSGVAISFTSDNNRDGKVDEWGEIENGRVRERRWSFYNDDIPDKLAKYREGRKHEESYDRNRDGVFEEVVSYDEYERPMVE